MDIENSEKSLNSAFLLEFFIILPPHVFPRVQKKCPF